MSGKLLKTFVSVLLLTAAGFLAGAQEREFQEYVDSVVYRLSPSVDSMLVGKSIFNMIADGRPGLGDVKIHQSQAIADAMKKHVAGNGYRKLSGYRVRIFFDNSQNARSTSETAVRKFSLSYPGVPSYRSYQNPFFKVAVGDFRTRSEAIAFLAKLKNDFPGSLVVKEDISFPTADRRHSYVVDTVRVAGHPAAL